MNYTPAEMMIFTAARALVGSKVVFVGVGLPNIACNLAQRSHSPKLELVYESGIFGAHPARLPLSIGDPTLVSEATSVISMADLFMLYLQGGLVDTALLGGAQIDRFGNLNTTVIGSYQDPRVRLPGSGGACEIAVNAGRILIIMRLKKRAFVEELDFLTSPGHLRGGTSRKKAGLQGKGPDLVITDRALFSFDSESKEMTLEQAAQGETPNSIQAEISWRLKIGAGLKEMPPPADDDLDLIRTVLDPDGLYR